MTETNLFYSPLLQGNLSDPVPDSSKITPLSLVIKFNSSKPTTTMHLMALYPVNPWGAGTRKYSVPHFVSLWVLSNTC